ncbi:MAG: RagB/SusD family nutrient uptake outer membrane protein [Ferruginibacter sp.]
MNKIFKYFLVAGFASVSLTACEKQLDQFPADSIELSQSFQTLKDAKTWDNGLYARVRGVLYGSFMFTQDVQGDQLNASLDFGNRNGNPHRWGQSFLADDGALTTSWSTYYSVITNVNLGLDNLGKIPTANATESAELDRYKGDAYMTRAFCYLELMLRFAKPYEPATAATTPGVPLVLTYDINAKPTRASSKQVYDQIISDITNAKTLLASATNILGSTRFSSHSAIALEARARLYMQDWAGAKTAAETIINAGLYPLATTSADISAMWKTDLNKEVITQVVVSKPNELPNVNSIYLGFVAATGKFTPDFIPSQWVVDFYDNADFRKAVYFEKKTLTIQGVDYPNIWLVNKYPGNPALFTGATTNYAQQPKIFRSAEMYLISAEAGARQGGANEAAALTRLNSLRNARGLASLVGLTGTALFQAVKDERFRELAFEGFRLWDLKRWHEGFTRTAPQSTAFIQVGPTYNTLSIPADDNKFVWGIPTRELTTNPNLAGSQNAGW